MSAHNNNHQPHGVRTEYLPAFEALFPWPAETARSPGLPVGGKPSHLFSSFKLRDVELKNRIVVSPMCQYSSPDGFFTDWHLVHLGGFATGGAGLIFTEATAVADIGRISPYDTGLWKDEHIAPLKRIVDFIHAHQAAAGIQIAHAGRKANTNALWVPTADTTFPRDHPLFWQSVGPSAIPWGQSYMTPHELTAEEIQQVKAQFVATTKRAVTAGFDVLEIHGAHGYLISSFLSPTSNKRTDNYGGSFENRIRLLLEVTEAVRAVWPATKPLFVRLSCNEWVDDGWTPDDTVAVAKRLKALGVDVVDCSSGGNNSKQVIKAGPGFQVPYAERVRKEAGLHSMAVGLITDAQQAESIVAEGRADLVALARELLRDSKWPLHAAHTLGVDALYPSQYERAKPKL